MRSIVKRWCSTLTKSFMASKKALWLKHYSVLYDKISGRKTLRCHVYDPVNAINAEKLQKIWKNIMIKLTDRGFEVVITMTGGHSVNVKVFHFFQDQLCQGETDIPQVKIHMNPINKIFLLVDTIHLLKKITITSSEKKLSHVHLSLRMLKRG